jgi:hypothetical protein
MKNDEAQTKRTNIVAFPEDKMEAVIKALKPILGSQADGPDDPQSSVLADFPGMGTGCTRTTASDDWSCTDLLAIE